MKAGYSGTPLLKKLGIKENMKVQLIGHPEDYFIEDVIRNYTLLNNLVDVKVCAVDDLWRGLKLVVPLGKI